MGIIRSFKAQYKKALVRHCLKTIEEKENMIMPTVKEAIILINKYNINHGRKHELIFN
jgi:hypothetical protein